MVETRLFICDNKSVYLQSANRNKKRNVPQRASYISGIYWLQTSKSGFVSWLQIIWGLEFSVRSSTSMPYPAPCPSEVTSSLEVSAAFLKGLFPWRYSVSLASNYRLVNDTCQTPDGILDWRSWMNYFSFYWTNPKNVTNGRDRRCCVITATTHRYNSLIFCHWIRLEGEQCSCLIAKKKYWIKEFVLPINHLKGDVGEGPNIGHSSRQ